MIVTSLGIINGVIDTKLDHIVITTAVLEACIDFYQALDFEVRDAEGHYELFAGDFKINVHIKDRELSPPRRARTDQKC